MRDQFEDEDALIRRAQQRDEQAFVRLIERITPRIMPTISRLVRNAEDANDVLQDVYIQMYKSLPRFRWQSSFSTFLYALVENVCKTAYARNQRLPARFTDLVTGDDARPFDESLADGTSDPHMLYEQRERLRAVQHAVLALPMKYRMVFVLADIQGESYQVIAERLGMNIGTVKSRLNRARERFQKLILAHGNLSPTSED